MKKILRKSGKMVLGLWMLVALLSFAVPAQAAKVLWEFDVPIFLKNMPNEVKYVCVHWYLYGENFADITNKRECVPVTLNANGDFSTKVKIKIYDSDMPDPSLARTCVFEMMLSEDGAMAHKLNTPGKSWTNVKKGTKSTSIVSVVKLNETPENHPWKA